MEPSAEQLLQSSRYILQAAEQGICRAMSSVAFCYQRGMGCRVDATSAVHWYRRLAGGKPELAGKIRHFPDEKWEFWGLNGEVEIPHKWRFYCTHVV